MRQITEGENAYVWVVRDLDVERMWVFYDGEAARNFTRERAADTGNRVICSTFIIEDMQSQVDEIYGE